MKNLYIIGARGYGREVYNIFVYSKNEYPEIECKGFLDDNPDVLKGFNGYPPIISSVEEYEPQENDLFICALGEPKWIRYYTSIIEKKGGKFFSLISPLACIGTNTIIGDGCIIGRYVVITTDVIIGKHTSMGVFTNIGHDVTIGDCCHLGAYTFVAGRCHIGDEVTIHPRVNIVPNKNIGDKAVIGVASVVLKNVKSGDTVFGVPAKKI